MRDHLESSKPKNFDYATDGSVIEFWYYMLIEEDRENQ